MGNSKMKSCDILKLAETELGSKLWKLEDGIGLSEDWTVNTQRIFLNYSFPTRN